MRDGYLPLVCKAAVISIVLLLTGCGGNYSETEFHPSGEISEKLEEGTRVLYDYDAEDKSQTLYFGSCGGGRLFWQEEGHNSDNCFRVGERKDERDGVFLMLEDQDGAAGYIIIAHSWSTEAGGPMIILEELYLIPGARGKGYAGEFFRWFFEEYRDRAAGYRLEVAPKNSDVIPLYEKFGYENLEYIQLMKSL